MKVVFGGMTYATINRKIGIEIANVAVDRTIPEGIKEHHYRIFLLKFSFYP